MMVKPKILVPVDFSSTAERAFRFALRIGTLLDAELHLLHVIYPQMENIDQPKLSSSKATITKSHALEEKLKAFVINEKDRWVQKGEPFPNTYVHIEIGGAIAVIKNRAKKHAYDLIIMGTRDKHEAVENMLGTVASDVVGNAACPVIVIPWKNEDKAIVKVAHAIEPHLMNLEAVNAIVEQFFPLHKEVHLIRFSAEVSSGAPPKLQQLKTQLNTQFPDLAVETHRLGKKHLVKDINTFVQEKDIDLLIMYRSTGGILRRLFHRSYTRLMARYTQIPLLVI